MSAGMERKREGKYLEGERGKEHFVRLRERESYVTRRVIADADEASDG